MGFSGGASDNHPPANTGVVRDADLIPRSGGSPGGGHNNPLQYSCLENRRDRVPRGLQSKELDLTEAT